MWESGDNMNANLESKILERFSWMIARNLWTGKKLKFCMPMSCIDENTLILMSNYTWKQIKNIEIGDEIIGVQKGKQFYEYTNATIINKINNGIKKCSLVSSKNNNLLITEDHPIFCKEDNHRYKYIETNKIKNKYLPIVFDMPNFNKDFELGWITGLLESDGYKINHKRLNKTYVGIKMINYELIKKLYDTLINNDFLPVNIKTTTYIKNSKTSNTVKNYPHTNNKELYFFTLYKNKDVQKLLNLFDYPLENRSKEFQMGWLSGFIDGDGYITNKDIRIYQKNKIEKLEKILLLLEVKYSKNLVNKKGYNIYVYSINSFFKWLILLSPFKVNNKIKNIHLYNPNVEKVNIINDYKECNVYDLTTTSGNFIANGFIVHNCSDGWYQLIYDLCEAIENHYKLNNANIKSIRIDQIKEKWGSLCFYIGNVIDGTYEIVHEYEKKSAHVCESCGAEATTKHRGSWLRTLCSACAKEQGYIDFKDEDI
jgi:hypothetical protein